MSSELGLDELFGGRSKKPKTVAATGERERPGNAPGITARPVPSGRSGSMETVSVETSRRIGRPPKPVGERYVDRVRRAAYYVDVETLDRLDTHCRNAGMAKSEAVRAALVLYLGEKEQK